MGCPEWNYDQLLFEYTELKKQVDLLQAKNESLEKDILRFNTKTIFEQQAALAAKDKEIERLKEALVRIGKLNAGRDCDIKWLIEQAQKGGAE